MRNGKVLIETQVCLRITPFREIWGNKAFLNCIDYDCVIVKLYTMFVY